MHYRIRANVYMVLGRGVVGSCSGVHFLSVFYGAQQYDICIHFNITYIINLATCFDPFESSSGVNFQ